MPWGGATTCRASHPRWRCDDDQIVRMQIGKRAREQSDELVDLLLDCHQRIRRFVAIAVRLAGAEEASVSEIRETASIVGRYFAEALPLHVLDEEESVLPRLRGLDLATDQALDAMHAEHGEHVDHVGELVSLCQELEREPETREKHRARLGFLGKILEEQFEMHLEREETIIFPRLAELPEQTQRDITVELRNRREPRR